MSAPRLAGPRVTIVTLAFISALGSMATHMVVPALPGIAVDLSIGTVTAQRIISVYLFGLAAGQLVAGPLVDRFGRRPVLLGGLALFLSAALVCAMAGGPAPLLAARLLQACGAAAGIVTSRVMVGDLFGRAEAGRRQANLMSVVLLSPALAPVLGGLIAGLAGWRMIFAVLAGGGVLALVLAARTVPESMPASAMHHRDTPLYRRYARLLRNPRFLRVVAAIAGGSTSLYMFLSVAPFLLIESWGLGEEEAGFCFLAVAAGGIAGTLLVGRVEARADALRFGLAISAIGAIIALALALALPIQTGWAMLIVPMMLVTVGAGIAGPSGFAAIVHVEEGLAGTAVSLAGALQMAASGFGAFALSSLAQPDLLLLTMAVSGTALFSLLMAPRTARAASSVSD